MSSRRRRRDFRRKTIAGAAAIAIHLAVIAAIFLSPSTPLRMTTLTEVADMQVSLASSAEMEASHPVTPTTAAAKPSPPFPSEPAPPPRPADVAPAPLPVMSSPSLAPVDITAQPVSLTTQPLSPSVPVAKPSSSAATATACDLTSALQHSLQADHQVLDELVRIPRQSKSVANALMLWDGAWSHGYAPGYRPGSDPLQQVIITAIQGVSPVCQAAVMQGPRLLWISTAGSTTVIALGSGSWRWSDLLASAGAAP